MRRSKGQARSLTGRRENDGTKSNDDIQPRNATYAVSKKKGCQGAGGCRRGAFFADVGDEEMEDMEGESRS